jgi:hypothetical protein
MKDKDGNDLVMGLDGKYFKPTIRSMRDRMKYPYFKCDRCPDINCNKGAGKGCNDRMGNI